MARRGGFLSTLLLLLVGCGGAPTGGGAHPASWSWSNAQLSPYTAVYELSGPTPGTATWQVKKAAGGQVSVDLRTSAGPSQEQDALILAQPGLALVSANEQLASGSTHVVISARVAAGKIQEDATVNGKVEKPSITPQSPWVANVALLPTLSGVPLKTGDRTVVQVALLKHASSVRLGLSVGKAASVTTRAGTFTAYPVQLTASGQTQTAWYMEKAPHAMVRYDNGAEHYTLKTLGP